MIVLEHDGAGRLQLAGRYELESTPVQSNLKNGSSDTKPIPIEVTNGIDKIKTKPSAGLYKYHKRLRVLPRRMVREVKIRMNYDDNH
jgi:hypothetical protein